MRFWCPVFSGAVTMNDSEEELTESHSEPLVTSAVQGLLAMTETDWLPPAFSITTDFSPTERVGVSGSFSLQETTTASAARMYNAVFFI